jgi:molecular chaperone HscA
LPSVVYYAARDRRWSDVPRRLGHDGAGAHDQERQALHGRGADDPETKRLGAYKFSTPASENDAKVVRFDVGWTTKTPVEVSAEILRSLKTSAVDQLRAWGAW